MLKTSLVASVVVAFLLALFLFVTRQCGANAVDDTPRVSSEPNAPAGFLDANVVHGSVSREVISPGHNRRTVHITFEDGTPASRIRCVAALAKVPREDIVSAFRTDKRLDGVSSVASTNSKGAVEWSEQPSSLQDPGWNLWYRHTPDGIQKRGTFGREQTEVHTVIPGGITNLRILGGANAASDRVHAHAVFTPTRVHNDKIESLADLRRLGPTRQPRSRSEDGGDLPFYGSASGFVHFFATDSTTATSSSLTNIPFLVQQVEDTHVMVLGTRDSGTLSISTADGLLQHPFAIRIEGENDFEMIAYSEDMPYGRYITNVPTGSVKVSLTKRFKSPISNAFTRQAARVLVHSGVNEVSLDVSTYTLVKFSLPSGSGAPLDVSVSRSGLDAYESIKRFAFYNADGFLSETDALFSHLSRKYWVPLEGKGTARLRVTREEGQVVFEMEVPLNSGSIYEARLDLEQAWIIRQSAFIRPGAPVPRGHRSRDRVASAVK